MRKKTEEYIKKYNMLGQGSKVIAAVSGGADSVCLLHMLVSLRPQLDLKIRAVHVHHGLRGDEADRDAQFVRELSKKWEVPCLVVYRDVARYAKENGLTVEEAGRKLRYEALYEAAKSWGGALIAVAHHQDDQAETILHNLFRGSGLKGIGGMAPVRGRIIRPLLCADRREIMDYLEEYKLSYCHDSTNDSTDYTRNKLRHKILPMVCEDINPKAASHIVAAGERVRQAEEYFEKEAGKLWSSYGQTESGEDGSYRRCGMEAQLLAGIPEILKGYAAMEIIRKITGSCKDITASHVEQILDLAQKGTGRSCSLPYGIRAYREYGMIWLETEGRKENAGMKVPLNDSSLAAQCFPAAVLREKYEKIPEKKYTKWFDYDKIKDTLFVRTRQTGDYFTLKDGKKKTIKAFMIDEKIPRDKRDQILLLAEGHHVLWITGYRISEFYKVTDETKQILQVRMDGGEEHGR